MHLHGKRQIKLKHFKDKNYEQIDYKVADIDLADWGERIVIAQSEMPALMKLGRDIKASNLKGAKILGCIHMTIQTAVLIET